MRFLFPDGHQRTCYGAMSIFNSCLECGCFQKWGLTHFSTLGSRPLLSRHPFVPMDIFITECFIKNRLFNISHGVHQYPPNSTLYQIYFTVISDTKLSFALNFIFSNYHLPLSLYFQITL